MFVDKPPRGLEYAEAPIHATMRSEAVGVLPALEHWVEVVVRGRQDDALWPVVVVWTVRVVVLVSVEATDALEEDVDGAQVSYEQVGVDVERLFERLGSHYDATSRLPLLPQQLCYSLVEHCAVAGGEAPVMERRHVFDVEQQPRVAVSGEFLQRLLRAHRVVDRVANDQHLRSLAGRRQRALSCVGKVAHGRAPLDGDRLFLVVFAGGYEVFAHIGRCADGGVGGTFHLMERRTVGDGSLPVMQPAMARRRAERCRHQKGVSPRAHMGVEQRFQDDAHVGVGCVYLVHDEQIAGEAGGAHVGVLELERAHHRLVNRADCDLRGEVSLGVLGHPRSLFFMMAGRCVVVFRHPDAGCVDAGFVAGHGAYDGRSTIREEVGDETLDALVYLNSGGAGRQGEVEAVHQSVFVHAGEPPKRGLRLAGAGLRLDNDEWPVERRVTHGLLNRVGRTVYPEQVPEIGYAPEGTSLSG